MFAGLPRLATDPQWAYQQLQQWRRAAIVDERRCAPPWWKIWRWGRDHKWISCTLAGRAAYVSVCGRCGLRGVYAEDII